MIYAIAVMVAGKLIFGFILGSIASTLANLDTQRVLFEEKLSALKVIDTEVAYMCPPYMCPPGHCVFYGCLFVYTHMYMYRTTSIMAHHVYIKPGGALGKSYVFPADES